MELTSLVSGAAVAVGASEMIRRLREHRATPTGLADVNLWGFLVSDEPGQPAIVLNLDGSLMAGWRYRGPDPAAATLAELNALSRHVTEALHPLVDDWLLHVDAIRRPAAPYPPSVFPDPITQLIDEERRARYLERAGRLFETDFVLVATFLPPPDTLARLASVFVQGAGGGSVGWEKVIGNFAVACHALETRLSGRISLTALDGDGVCRHLHECLTGLSHPVKAPPHGSYLNYTLTDQELTGGFAPTIGKRAIRCVAVHRYPAASHPGFLDVLNALPHAYRYSSRIRPLGQHAADRLLQHRRRIWFRGRRSALEWVTTMVGASKRAERPREDEAITENQDAREMAADAAGAISENASGAVRFAFYTQTIVVTDLEAARADYTTDEVIKALADAGITARVETVNALEAFMGTWPGHGHPNLRRPLLHTRNISDMLPVTSIWPGLSHNPSPYFPSGSPPLMWAATTGSTPFRVNIHDSDVGHTLIIGPTGAGKSTLLNLMIAQFRRYENAQVFAFDYGYSAWALASAAGATHYALAAGDPDALRFQPLGKIDDQSERVWAAEWVEVLAALQGVAVTPTHRARIDRALALVAANPREHRTLTELSTQLQDRELSAALRPYTVAGNYGQLLDATADDWQDSRFAVVELMHLMELGDRVVLPVLLYLFRRIEQRLDGSPTMIPVDEGWRALLHAAFAARLSNWALTLRKRNAALVFATQSLASLAASAYRHTIIGSCPTRLFLPNADAMTPGTAELYRDVGLNDRELEILAGATPKRHYYFASPRGSRLFELGLGPVALAFMAAAPGKTAEETRARQLQLASAHGRRWPAVWLAERGLRDAARECERALESVESPAAEREELALTASTATP